MRAALHVTRVVLDSADLKTAHDSRRRGRICPACIATAGISYGITLASAIAGDPMFVSEPRAPRLLAAVDAAEAELDERAELAGAARRVMAVMAWPRPCS